MLSNMKICWDNIENIKLTKKGNFRDVVKKKTYYLKICGICKEEYFGLKNSKCCSPDCNKSLQSIKMKNVKMSEATKQKISKTLKDRYEKIEHHNKGMITSQKTKEKQSESHKGSKSSFWKGGYHSNNIPSYDTYAHQIEWCEEVRRNKENPNILEVKCFKCGEWYMPTLISVHSRIQSFKNSQRGERRLYCSDVCKKSCSIYQQKLYPKGFKISPGREVQPQLRKMVLERDEHKCVKCNDSSNLQCHHIYPVSIEPLLSADINNCITLCEKCHIEVHKKDGCEYGQLRNIKEC